MAKWIIAVVFAAVGAAFIGTMWYLVAGWFKIADPRIAAGIATGLMSFILMLVGFIKEIREEGK